MDGRDKPDHDNRGCARIMPEGAKRAGATVTETPGSHSIYVSQPKVVAALIEKAAKAVETAAK